MAVWPTLLVYLSLCVFVVATKDRIQRSSLSRKVVGGNQVSSISEYPWQLSLFGRAGSGGGFAYHCGAVLLELDWALTSLHCVHDVPRDELLVAAGVTNLASRDAQFVPIKSIHYPAAHWLNQDSNDIALLQLQYPVDPHISVIRGIEVAKPNERFVDQICTVTGFGSTKGWPPETSDNLRSIRLSPQGQVFCQNFYNMTDKLTCASGEEFRTSVCHGDSGGPLVCHRDSNTPVLLGIVSSTSHICLTTQPGLFVRVGAHRGWLESVVQTRLKGTQLTTSRPILYIPKAFIDIYKVLMRTLLEEKPDAAISTTPSSRTIRTRRPPIARKFRRVSVKCMLKNMPLCARFLFSVLSKGKIKPMDLWRYNFRDRSKCAAWILCYFRYSIWQSWRRLFDSSSFSRSKTRVR